MGLGTGWRWAALAGVTKYTLALGPHPFETAGWAAAQEKQKPETVMTPEQAKELFASVDQIMAFASKDTGLPPVVKVKRKLLTRDEVNAYLVKAFDEDEGAKRLQQSEIVLKKFGLLNRDFNLRPFLLSLLTEQIAGFYDDKTKIVNLLNWVQPEEQKPVLAHELTHAIQDQKVNLEKWGSNGFKGVSKTASEDAQRVPVDELETARQAVTEGQAMVVFVDWGSAEGADAGGRAGDRQEHSRQCGRYQRIAGDGAGAAAAAAFAGVSVRRRAGV